MFGEEFPYTWKCSVGLKKDNDQAQEIFLFDWCSALVQCIEPVSDDEMHGMIVSSDTFLRWNLFEPFQNQRKVRAPAS